MATERFIIEWQAPEFEYRDKSVSWYWLSAIIAIIFLSVSVWQKNFLFSIFIVIAEILILVWAGRKPRTVKFAADEKGLTVDGRKFYPYSEMEAFGIIGGLDGEWSEIIFRPRRGLRALLRVMIPSARVREVEKTLGAAVEKKEIDETFFDALEKLMGF